MNGNYNDDRTTFDIYSDIAKAAGNKVITITREAINGEPLPVERTEQPRFKRHENKMSHLKIFLILLMVFLVLFLIGIGDSNINAVNDAKPSLLVVSVLGLAGCVGYLVLCHKNKKETDRLFPLTLAYDKYNRQFLNAENKLINLITQSPYIPDRFRDGFVSIFCIDKDDTQTVFDVKVKDVVGAVEFIEQNKDKWAASFGDRDGAELKVLGVGHYRLTFDTAGNVGNNATVSW